METTEVLRRLDGAVALAEQGRQREAEAQLRVLVASGARQPRACMALGVLCGERGDLAERHLWLRQARHLVDTSGEPPSLRLLLNQVVDALERGEPEQALIHGSEALSSHPQEAEAHLHQAQVLHTLGRTDEAAAHLRRARELLLDHPEGDPPGAKSWRLLAEAEQRAERLDGAIEAFGRALALEPNHLPTLLAMSRLLISRGSIDEAMPWLLNALAVAPEDPNVLCCNGIALRAIGEVIQAAELYRQALVCEPGHLEATCNLAGCLLDQGLSDEAAKVFREALVNHPGHMDCRLGLSVCLRHLGDMEESVAIQRELLEEAPQAQGLFNSWMFTTSISTVVPPAEVLTIARRFWEAKGVGAGPAVGPLLALPRIPTVGHPLRVGLLSADIGNHVVGLFLKPLLRHHDPKRCQLDLLSMRRLYDNASEELVALADGFHNLEGLPEAEARALLQGQQYDLIVDTSGYTRGSGLHLLAERCAPLQAHYIGYHATTGLATIDGFIGDEETAASELQDQFCERLWRLPRPWLAYPRDSEFPEANPLMQTDRPVLGSFCQVSKISQDTLLFWAEALRRVPEAVLVLKDKGLQDPVLRQRLEDRLANLGVHPGRLMLLAPVPLWWDHVDHYNLLDVALDTTPWSSATTGFEVLAMGVPLVTIRGNRMSARMSSSLVRGLDRNEWLADTPEAFAAIVANLCADLPKLRASKTTRQQEALASPLFDEVDLALQVTDLFVKVAAQESTRQGV